VWFLKILKGGEKSDAPMHRCTEIWRVSL